jgi:subtilisin family serine protease
MSKYSFLILSLLFLKVGLAQTVSPFYEDGNIYIKIKASAMIDIKDNKVKINNFPFLTSFANTYTVKEFRHLYSFAKHPGLENIYKISIAEINQLDQSVRTLSKLDQLEYAEKVPYKTYFATPPNDTSYNNILQWNLFKINAQVAWNFIGNPSPSQSIVAIIDDGLDINHIDLKDNLWINNSEMNGLPGVDDDGNFIIDDSLGYDFGDFDTDASPNDMQWRHGTHVSGIAGAVTNNIAGVASIGYNARLMAVKGSNSNLYVSNGYEAIAYAADNGADVINLSWGSPIESITESNTVLYAYYLDAVVVAAAGNSNDGTVNYPAAYPHVISVASSNSNDTKAFGSSFGQSVDVSAPGVNIYSTIPNNGYALLSGTSMAAPLVSGLAALMRTFNPLLTADQVEDCIKNNTDNIDFMNPNYPGKLGTGRINAFKAMQCVSQTRYQIDASLKGFDVPNAFSCTSSFIPKIALKNCGTTNLQSVSISYKVDGGALNTIQWSGDMAYDSLQYIDLSSISMNTGVHTLMAFCSNPNGVLDWSFFNDTITTSFQIYNAGISLPFIEDFENGLANQSWRLSNPDADKTWEVKSGSLDGVPNKAAFINLFNYSDEGQRDGLITPPLNFSGYDSLKLQFDYAWKRNFRQVSDSLIIFASTDCGASFPYRIGAFYQDTLTLFATDSDTMEVFFNPTLSPSWCGNIIDCIELDLTTLAGNSSVLIKFETYNNFNNNLFLDNINISGVSLSTASPTNNTISSNSTAICQGGLITFTANDPNNNTTQWNWTFSNGNPSTVSGQSVTIQFDAPGTVNASLIVGNSNGTANVSLTNSVTVNALPNVNILQNDTTICADNSITLNVSGANNYVWNPSTGLSDTTGSVVTALPQQPITYIVWGSSSAGCVSYDTISIDTTVCLGLSSASVTSHFQIYYNAANGFIMIKTGDTDIKNQTLTLYNTIGQIIYESSINQNSGTVKSVIDCNALSTGLYFASMAANGNKLRTEKLLIVKQ